MYLMCLIMSTTYKQYTSCLLAIGIRVNFPICIIEGYRVVNLRHLITQLTTKHLTYTILSYYYCLKLDFSGAFSKIPRTLY